MDTAERGLPYPDLLPLVDLLAPECIEITPDALRIGQEYACGLAVTACPREVTFDGWLSPLFQHDEVMDVSFHYHPQQTATMKRQLVRQRTGHASGRHLNRREGRADDPDALVAEEDINRLLDDLARTRERVFDLGFYFLLRTASREALAERVERLYSVLGLLSLDAATYPATFEHTELFQSCLPQARDELLHTSTQDSTTLATMFPFQSNSLCMPGGVLVGVSETHEPVLLNPWDSSLENPHLFIGGVTGSGKSYLGKLLVERDLLPRAG
jgi:type IV secretory pathway VirB4 component